MQGTLDTFSVVEMLQLLGKARRSGTLHIECPQRLIDVHFVHGRVAETRDSTRVATDTVIGRQLCKRALITGSQLDAALAEQERRPRPLGTILVTRGFVSEPDLRVVVSRQVANTLVGAKLEAAGSFVFVTDPAPAEIDFIAVDIQPVLMEISALGGEYCFAVEVLGDADAVLVRNVACFPEHGSPLMGPDESRALAEVDGCRTVREVAAASGLEEITAVSVLGKLAEAGVLLVRAGRRGAGVADAELKAHRDSVWLEVDALLDGAAPEQSRDEVGPAAPGSA